MFKLGVLVMTAFASMLMQEASAGWIPPCQTVVRTGAPQRQQQCVCQNDRTGYVMVPVKGDKDQLPEHLRNYLLNYLHGKEKCNDVIPCTPTKPTPPPKCPTPQPKCPTPQPKCPTTDPEECEEEEEECEDEEECEVEEECEDEEECEEDDGEWEECEGDECEDDEGEYEYEDEEGEEGEDGEDGEEGEEGEDEEEEEEEDESPSDPEPKRNNTQIDTQKILMDFYTYKMTLYESVITYQRLLLDGVLQYLGSLKDHSKPHLAMHYPVPASSSPGKPTSTPHVIHPIPFENKYVHNI